MQAVAALRRPLDDSRYQVYKAREARRILTNKQALHARRQRALANFSMPPGAHALPDEAPDRTARLLARLLARLRERECVASDSAPASPVHPAAVAYQHLRLHLLETEAATLAAWLEE
ncbi:MAG: hypothetical protein H7330_15625 [Hymenobacteraceae bacterium]|nr:hypothetical protein [Hymenobacteraceae bacterium]